MAQRGRPRKNVITEQENVAPVEVEQEEQTRAEVKIKRSGRPGRTPINGYRDILRVDGQEAGFHYAWVRDDLVPRFESAAYEFVTHALTVGDRKLNSASQIGSKVSIPGGNGRTLYLMRVLDEYYKEDMAAYNAEVDAREAAMLGKLNSKEGGRYGQVQIDHRLKNRI